MARPKCARRNDEGFGMVELLIAFLLLTIVLAGSLAMQIRVSAGNQESRVVSVAASLAQQAIEEFNAAGFTSLAAGAVTDRFTYTGQKLVPAVGGFYQRNATVSLVGTSYIVDVQVYWPPYDATAMISMRGERAP